MLARFGRRAIVLTCLHILHLGVSSTSTGLQAPPGITVAPNPVIPVSTTSFEVRSSASDLSVAFIGALPLLENWIQTPDAPRVTAVTDTLNDILPKALDLLDKLPTPTHGAEPCYNSRRRRREREAPRPRQRSPFGGLFKTPFSLLNCIVDTTSKLRDEVINGTKDTAYTAGTIQHVLKPMLDALNEVEDIKPPGSPSGTPTSPEATSASLRAALATTTIGGHFKRGDGDKCTTACAAPVTTSSGTVSTSASTTTCTTTVSRFVCAPTCTTCNSEHPRLPADDSILPGHSQAPNGILVKPSSIATGPLSEDISVKDETVIPTPSKISGQHKRALSHPDEFRDLFASYPTHDDAITAWLVHEIVGSKRLAHGELPLHTTGITALLFNRPEKWSLVDLYGCTSVIVISPRRMYMAHIWEFPTMNGTPEIFREQALRALEFGDAGTPGLEQYTMAGGDFESRRDNHVYALIITPLMHRNQEVQPQVLRYQHQVDQISELLQRILGPRRPRAVHGPRKIKTIPYVSRTADKDLQFGHGKVLIQYDPADIWIKEDKSIEQYAGIEVWFENYPKYRVKKRWRASPHQTVAQPGDAKVWDQSELVDED